MSSATTTLQPSTSSSSGSNNGMLDLESSPITGQIGYAILDVQGNLLQLNNFQEQDTKLLFAMLQESATLLKNKDDDDDITEREGLKRITVTFQSSCRFVISRDEHYIYLVQTKV